MDLYRTARLCLATWCLVAVPVAILSGLGGAGLVAVCVPVVAAAAATVLWLSYREDEIVVGVPGQVPVARRAVDLGELPADEVVWGLVQALAEHRRTALFRARLTALGGGAVLLGVLAGLALDDAGLPQLLVAVLVAATVAVVLLAVRRDEARLDALDDALAGWSPGELPAPPW